MADINIEIPQLTVTSVEIFTPSINISSNIISPLMILADNQLLIPVVTSNSIDIITPLMNSFNNQLYTPVVTSRIAIKMNSFQL
ncbi:MAG: hypothetical protein PHH31_08640 [Acidaminococcaceae bacterium]|nr:hypothetical protein [Acidaminococcaceae bacterium]